MKRSVFIGYDPRETDAYLVTRESIRKHLKGWLPIEPLILQQLRERGLYRRETLTLGGRMIDAISDAPMSTEFAISRFLALHLARNGWAAFMDCDMLVRTDLNELFELADPTKAVMCVQHEHVPAASTKMDDQIQLRYARKNWSSLMLFNASHPANQRLTVDMINALPGRDLHAFCWLKDDEIGALGPEWNYLVGTGQKVTDPKIVHFTNGIPRLAGYEESEFADEWRQTLWTALGVPTPDTGGFSQEGAD